MDLYDLGRRYRDWPEVKALIAELRAAREAQVWPTGNNRREVTWLPAKEQGELF